MTFTLLDNLLDGTSSFVSHETNNWENNEPSEDRCAAVQQWNDLRIPENNEKFSIYWILLVKTSSYWVIESIIASRIKSDQSHW